jgi:hypothetical protein
MPAFAGMTFPPALRGYSESISSKGTPRPSRRLARAFSTRSRKRGSLSSRYSNQIVFRLKTDQYASRLAVARNDDPTTALPSILISELREP